MYYKRVKIKLSERHLMRLVLGTDFPDDRKILHQTEFLDTLLERFKKEEITESDAFNKQAVEQFNQTPIHGLRVGEVLKLNEYRIVSDSNDNILLYINNPNDRTSAKTIHEVIFLYDSEDFFRGSKMMQGVINKINEINQDLDVFYDLISRDAKVHLKNILRDEYKLDSLMRRNRL